METKELDIKKNTLEKQAAKLRKQRRRQMLASTFGIIILLVGLYQIGVMFFSYKLNETSNDAQIEQYISPVNLRASGYIKKVYFTEHQTVKKGDTLMVLDDREYRIRVMEAEAALKDAMAGASVIGQTLQTTKASASVYEASISEVEIRLAKLDKDRKRYENLLQRNAATPIQLEQIETEYEATKKKLVALKRQQEAAMSGVNEVSTRRQNMEAAIQRNPSSEHGSCHTACTGRTGNGKTQSFIHSSYRTMRRTAGTPCHRGRTVHFCRTDHNLHIA